VKGVEALHYFEHDRDQSQFGIKPSAEWRINANRRREEHDAVDLCRRKGPVACGAADETQQEHQKYLHETEALRSDSRDHKE